mgnify:CR=1 FL=1
MTETILKGNGNTAPQEALHEIKQGDVVTFKKGGGDILGKVTEITGFEWTTKEPRVEVCFVIKKPGGGSREIRGIFPEGRLKKVFPETPSLH